MKALENMSDLEVKMAKNLISFYEDDLRIQSCKFLLSVPGEIHLNQNRNVGGNGFSFTSS